MTNAEISRCNLLRACSFIWEHLSSGPAGIHDRGYLPVARDARHT
jgi:hypothetical protein